MGHHHSFDSLVTRLNKFPQGAPPSDRLFDILKMLFTEKEAGLVAQLPIRPFTAEDAAAIWKCSLSEAQKTLDTLASRALLVDIEQQGEQTYCLPPPMAGFFEFSLMRVRTDIDQKALSELYYQYINEEEDFIRDLFVRGETSLGRVFVQERAVKSPYDLEILDYERATHIIETATAIGVGICYCRHKMEHVGKACDAPQDICMTFNTAAHSLIKYGHARAVDKSECLELLHKAWDHNLVQFGENNRQGVNFICNCCGCCCEALLAVQRFGITRSIHSNFILHPRRRECVGCGLCVKRCPVNALSMETTPQGERPVVNKDICLGCGVCVRCCPKEDLELVPRPERVIPPVNTVHRAVVMAAERGTLQELIANNNVLLSHRLLGALISCVLKLPGLSQQLARKQLRSRYIEKLCERI